MGKLTKTFRFSIAGGREITSEPEVPDTSEVLRKFGEVVRLIQREEKRTGGEHRRKGDKGTARESSPVKFSAKVKRGIQKGD